MYADVITNLCPRTNPRSKTNFARIGLSLLFCSDFSNMISALCQDLWECKGSTPHVKCWKNLSKTILNTYLICTLQTNFKTKMISCLKFSPCRLFNFLLADALFNTKIVIKRGVVRVLTGVAPKNFAFATCKSAAVSYDRDVSVQSHLQPPRKRRTNLIRIVRLRADVCVSKCKCVALKICVSNVPAMAARTSWILLKPMIYWTKKFTSPRAPYLMLVTACSRKSTSKKVSLSVSMQERSSPTRANQSMNKANLGWSSTAWDRAATCSTFLTKLIRMEKDS